MGPGQFYNFKAAVIIIFILRTDRTAACKCEGSLVEMNPRRNTAKIIRCVQLCEALEFQPITLLFWFTLTTLISLVFRHSRKQFQYKGLDKGKKSTKKVCTAASQCKTKDRYMEHLAAKERVNIGQVASVALC